MKQKRLVRKNIIDAMPSVNSKARNTQPYIPPQAVGYVQPRSKNVTAPYQTTTQNRSRNRAENASRKMSGKKELFEFSRYENPTARAVMMQNEPWRKSQLQAHSENEQIESSLPYKIYKPLYDTFSPLFTYRIPVLDGRKMYEQLGIPVKQGYYVPTGNRLWKDDVGWEKDNFTFYTPDQIRNANNVTFNDTKVLVGEVVAQPHPYNNLNPDDIGTTSGGAHSYQIYNPNTSNAINRGMIKRKKHYKKSSFKKTKNKYF